MNKIIKYMKYRIKKVTQKNNKCIFIPQYKSFIGLWLGWADNFDFPTSLFFHKMSEAEDFLSRQRSEYLASNRNKKNKIEFINYS